jgi:hypothetical protein
MDINKIPAWIPAVVAVVALVWALKSSNMRLKLGLGLTAVVLFAVAIWWQLQNR